MAAVDDADERYNDTSLTIKQRNEAWLVHFKDVTKDLGFFAKLEWKMSNKPLELLCKSDLQKVLYSLVGGCVFYLYTVIVSKSTSDVAFVLAILNWVCLGLETNLLRFFLFYRQNPTSMNALYFAQLLNAIVAVLGVIVVCSFDIQEVTDGAYGKANIAIYVIMNLINIVGNAIGAFAFDALRRRMFSLANTTNSSLAVAGAGAGAGAVASHGTSVNNAPLAAAGTPTSNINLRDTIPNATA